MVLGKHGTGKNDTVKMALVKTVEVIKQVKRAQVNMVPNNTRVRLAIT